MALRHGMYNPKLDNLIMLTFKVLHRWNLFKRISASPPTLTHSLPFAWNQHRINGDSHQRLMWPENVVRSAIWRKELLFHSTSKLRTHLNFLFLNVSTQRLKRSICVSKQEDEGRQASAWAKLGASEYLKIGLNCRVQLTKFGSDDQRRIGEQRTSPHLALSQKKKKIDGWFFGWASKKTIELILLILRWRGMFRVSWSSDPGEPSS